VKRSRRRLVSALVLSATLLACGKKGPPLPPLVRLPAAPAELTASRRAEAVDIRFVVPNANSDNTRPANIARVDVYALTGQAAVTDLDVLARGSRIASLAVKTPRDPNATYDPEDPDQSEADVEPPQGEGLDQGAVATVRDVLRDSGAGTAGDVRTYVGVAVTARGRRGGLSRLVAVPLGPSPPAPSSLAVEYTEDAITVRWPASADGGASDAFHVYEYDAAAAGSPQAQLTKAPVAAGEYVDRRMTWGQSRCYVVRRVRTVGALAVESEPSPPACVTLRDTFPPAAPKGLQAVATTGVISLIWDANTEPDVDGYILLRAMAPGDELIPVTTATIHETAFQDPVPPGIRFVYAIQAIDRAGNLSQSSARVEETAR
jgi:hypothetical protein